MPETNLYWEATIKNMNNMAPAYMELTVYSGIKEAHKEVIMKSLKCNEGKRERYNKKNVI